jgi:hypothetical protein
MFNIKTLAFSAMIALGAWAFAATIGFGALVIASSAAPVAPNAPGIAAAQIDTVNLMARAGTMPVDIAPMP